MVGVEHHGLGGIEMKSKNRLPFNLQFFAEEASPSNDGVSEGEVGTEGQSTSEEGQDEGGKQPSFDDFLKDKAMQAEFDRRLNKALSTQKANLEKGQQQAIQEALTEAEKLRTMKADEKAEYERQKKEDDYNKRLAELTVRELKATAKDTLASEGLPLGLVEVLNYTDAESCNQSIEVLKVAFREAVSQGINDKLRGKGTPRSGQGGNQDTFNFGFTGVRPRQ